ncbi:hypothetical protein [Qipengyuania atrilutea]|uniref:Uncharacterized protein n=1 Tax=Qipengyuania atrilutea TaxID=2744473 RepID=A0A850H2D9_9SPHN|nr:hypothetical protein [Actirhodobacter atriluteus]NVD44372.1 hypothetical protein [Actirhodobacter atriluteus]
MPKFKEDSGDWTIDAVRRTRIGGAWTGGAIPIGEASEAYQVTLGNGTVEATVTTPSLPYTWTVADQTTATGAEVPEGSLEYSIAQISALVGAGYEAEATA